MSVSLEKINLNESEIISSLVKNKKKTLEEFLQENLENTKKNFLKKEVVVLANGDSLLVELSGRAQSLKEENISLKGFDPFLEYRQKTFFSLASSLKQRGIF